MMLAISFRDLWRSVVDSACMTWYPDWVSIPSVDYAAQSSCGTCRIEWQEVKDGAWGAKNESGHWIGMLGEIVRKVSSGIQYFLT